MYKAITELLRLSETSMLTAELLARTRLLLLPKTAFPLYVLLMVQVENSIRMQDSDLTAPYMSLLMFLLNTLMPCTVRTGKLR